MGRSSIKKYLPWLAAAGLLLLFLLFSDTGLCVFRKVTGLPCPSCGMTRSFLELFKGDTKGAFLMHPLFWTIPIIAVLVIYSKYRHKNFTVIYIILAVLFIIVYILRMLFLFPDTYPFTYDHSSILGRLLIN